MQIGFVGTATRRIASGTRSLREVTPGFFIEGQHGPLRHRHHSARSGQDAGAVAHSSTSSVCRAAPSVDVDPAIKIKGDNAKALEQAGLKELHERGYRRQGGARWRSSTAISAAGKSFVKKKQLPAKTRLVDLTTEADPEIYPQPYRDLNAIGHGTLCAQAAALAAPAAELVLIRVDVDRSVSTARCAALHPGGQAVEHSSSGATAS